VETARPDRISPAVGNKRRIAAMNDKSDWFSNETATIGDRIAGAREAAGLGQSELARKLGVKIKTVRGWENDLTEPRANKLQMLSGLLNVSLMWLLNGEGQGLDAPMDEQPISPDVAALLRELREIRVEMDAATERLARTEKRLRAALNAETTESME
jgi:transcriptional regulator with XRE-family HTH domain